MQPRPHQQPAEVSGARQINGIPVQITSTMKYPIPFFLFAILMILLSTNCDQGSSACPSNASRDVDGECGCNEGFVEDSEGDCVPIDCPENSTLNPATKECECMEGYIKTTDGTCIPDPGVNCPENSTYNASTQACECNEGFELNEDGECVEKVDCPPNSSYSEATDACECDEGYEEDYYGDCIKKEEEEDCPEKCDLHRGGGPLPVQFGLLPFDGWRELRHFSSR